MCDLKYMPYAIIIIPLKHKLMLYEILQSSLIIYTCMYE